MLKQSDPTVEKVIAAHYLKNDIGLLVCSPDWRVIWHNEPARAMLGADTGDMTTLPSWKPLLSDGDETPGLPKGLIEIICPNNVVFHAFAICSVQGDLRVVQLCEATDISQHIVQMSYEQNIWKHAIESAGHGVWHYNSNNEAMFVSDEWKRIRGIPLDRPFHDTYDDWIKRLHPDDAAATLEHVRRHNSGETSNFSYDYRERHTSGHYVWIHCSGRVIENSSDGKALRVIGTDIDISRLKQEEQERQEKALALHKAHIAELENAHARTEAARQIAHMLSRQDPLSQLPNRRVFAETIAEAIEKAGTSGRFAVMIVDLDRFKPVNDLYGHAAGDAVIVTAAKRLLNAIEDRGLVARLGGDEFGVLLRTDAADPDETVRHCAATIIKSLEEPFHIDDLVVEIGASIGVAMYPQDGSDQKTLFRHADMALYVVKQGRKGTHIFYSENMGKAAEAKATLDAAVRRAVIEDDFEPYFQPIVDLKSGAITCFELLARWRHPKIGVVPPDQFISIIEQSRMMPQFTNNLLRKACLIAREWPSHISMSVNLSAREVCNLATPIHIFRVLASARYPLSRLRVEVTEQALMKDMFLAKQVVSAFRGAGARVSLDDFGAGYAGLGYLRELRFDSIKIDRSFISTMLRQPESRKIVESMQALANNLGLETIAEGVEDAATVETIKEVGCSSAQGYYFSRPLPAAEVPALLGRAPGKESAAS